MNVLKNIHVSSVDEEMFFVRLHLGNIKCLQISTLWVTVRSVVTHWGAIFNFENLSLDMYTMCFVQMHSPAPRPRSTAHQIFLPTPGTVCLFVWTNEFSWLRSQLWKRNRKTVGSRGDGDGNYHNYHEVFDSSYETLCFRAFITVSQMTTVKRLAAHNYQPL